MDCKRIEILLEKYWQCTTTLEEEKELRSCFNGEEILPPGLEEYRDFFEYQEAERNIRLDQDFDRKILNQLSSGKEQERRTPILLRRVAAAIVVVFVAAGGIGIHFHQELPEQALPPEKALAEIEQTLFFVSSKLNYSQQIIEEKMSRMKVITRYIKE